MSEKRNNLQQFVQQAADTAWRASQNNSQYDPNPTGFGKNLEFTLQARSGELSRLLNQIAEDELSQVDRSPEPIDFTKFVRISNQKFTQTSNSYCSTYLHLTFCFYICRLILCYYWVY